MIPIECPKCGREGNVPPDRLNAKLTCRGCQAVFHLDNSGRMVMGAPGDPDKDKRRPNVQYSGPAEPLDIGAALRNIPKPVKFGVPAVLVALAAWLLMPGGVAGYESSAETIARALVGNSKPRVVSYSIPSSADAAGKWFDMMHAQAEKQGVTSAESVAASLYNGNPDRDSNLILTVVVTGSSPSSTPLSLNLYMNQVGGSWLLDGTKTLESAEAAVSATKKARP